METENRIIYHIPTKKLSLDDFIIHHGVKNINIRYNRDHNVMRDIHVEFEGTGRDFDIFCHEDNIENMLRTFIPKHSKLGQRKLKINKLKNKIK